MIKDSDNIENYKFIDCIRFIEEGRAVFRNIN